MNALSGKADSSASRAWIAVCAIVLAALVGQAGVVLAADTSDAPDTIAEADWIGIRQVLVIPQQCSREAVSTLCDRSDRDDLAVDRRGHSRFAVGSRHGADYGTVADYERQRTAGSPVPVAPGYVTIPPAISVAPSHTASRPASRAR